MKCTKTFHKKCTNRSGTRGSNWSKDPWICPECACTEPLIPQPSVQTQSLHSCGPSTVPALGQGPSSPTSGAAALSLTSSQSGGSASAEKAPTNQGPQVKTPSASYQGLSTSQSQRFPNNSIRQRISTIASVHPEQEFLKAALDACRSTIVQQEADIKHLKESLDIRNKKIVNLRVRLVLLHLIYQPEKQLQWTVIHPQINTLT